MRYENAGKNVTEWCNKTGEGSSTVDLCPDCANEVDADPFIFVEHFNKYLKPDEPVGEDGWEGGYIDPPPYADDPDMYCCDVCGESLAD